MSVRVRCFAGESYVVCSNRSRLSKSASHSDDHAHTNRYTTSLSRRRNDLADSSSPLASLSCNTLGFGVDLCTFCYVCGSAGAADRHIGVANNMPKVVAADLLHFRQANASDVDVLVQFNQAMAKVGQQRRLS